MNNNKHIIPLYDNDAIDNDPGIHRLSSRRSAIRPSVKVSPDYVNSPNMCKLCFKHNMLQQCKICSTFLCYSCIDKKNVCNGCKAEHRQNRTIFRWFCCG